MGQQTVPCTPPPRTAEGGFIFFRIGVSVPKKNVLEGKLVLFGVIQVKRPPKRGFSLYSLNQNFDKLKMIS